MGRSRSSVGRRLLNAWANAGLQDVIGGLIVEVRWKTVRKDSPRGGDGGLVWKGRERDEDQICLWTEGRGGRKQ